MRGARRRGARPTVLRRGSGSLSWRGHGATTSLMFRSATFWVVLALASLAAADLVLHEGATLLFLARELLALIGWLAFWR